MVAADLGNSSRREFLRKALALSGGALVAAGLLDLAFTGVETKPIALPTGAATQTQSISNGNLLPDYLDFLEWMKSVSDKIPSKSVSISLEIEFAPYAIQRRDSDFFGYSQAATQYDLLPYLAQLEAVSLMLQTKSPTHDVFSVDNQNIASFKDAIIPPSELAQTYADLTYPRFDYQDFLPTIWDYVAVYPPLTTGTVAGAGGAGGGNQLTGLSLVPFDAPLMIFLYRKDIYDKLGLSPPTTWDEYYSQVQKLPGNGTPYASVSMANADVSVVYEYMNHLASFGGSLWEIDKSSNTLVPTMDSDACVAALENYVRFAKYADPGSHSYTWTDQFTSLATGVSATALLWYGYYDWLNDPARSYTSGKFLPSLNPAGPKGSFSTYGGSGLAVSRYSRRPEAAYVWMQWASCKGVQEEMLLDTYHIFPTRSSVFDVSQIKDLPSSPTTAALAVAKQAWASGTTSLTPFPLWLQVLVPIAAHLSSAWTGAETPKQALTGAKNSVESLGPLHF